jgi:DNA polymerase-1
MDPIKKIKLGPEAVFEKFGVTPDKVVDVQALAGDSTDNVPGAPGIGIKTAAQLINEYGNLETLLERTKEIKQPKRRESLENNAELIRISKQLVSLRDDVPAPADPDSFDKRKPDPNVLLPWLEQQGFRTLLQRFTGELGEATAPVAPPSGPAPMKKADPTPAPAASSSKKPNRDFTTADYELIQDETLLDEWIAEATRAGTVAFDCETDGLDSNNAGLVGVSLALLEGPWGDVNSSRRRAAYLPLMHRTPGAAVQGRARSFGRWRRQGCRQAARRTDPLQDRDRKAEAVAGRPGGAEGRPEHQIRHGVFRRHGIEIGADRRHDADLVRARRRQARARHGRARPSCISGRTTIKFSDVAGSGKTQVTFDKVPLDKAVRYAAEDADVTCGSGRAEAAARPRARRRLYETLERPLIPVLAAMESAGIKVDALKLAG